MRLADPCIVHIVMQRGQHKMLSSKKPGTTNPSLLPEIPGFERETFERWSFAERIG